MMNHKLSFPARDKFEQKSWEALKTMKILETQLEELKQEFMKFKWYEQLAVFKEEEEEPLKRLIKTHKRLHETMFTKPDKTDL